MSSMQRTIRRNVARIADNGRTKRYGREMAKKQLKIDREKYAQEIAVKKAKKAAKPGILSKIRSALSPNRGASK